MVTTAAALARTYYASLPNTGVHQPKRIVVFSGVPGSGKSRIARAIERTLRAIRISNDEIRDLITADNPTITAADRERLKLDIAATLLDLMATSPNGLVVFDASCDRPGGYAFYRDWAKQHGYRVVLIRLSVPRTVIEARIRQRGDVGYRKAARLLANLDDWWNHWEALGQRQHPDMVVTPKTPLEDIMARIRKP